LTRVQHYLFSWSIILQLQHNYSHFLSLAFIRFALSNLVALRFLHSITDETSVFYRIFSSTAKLPIRRKGCLTRVQNTLFSWSVPLQLILSLLTRQHTHITRL
jgi:hypothetical protein